MRRRAALAARGGSLGGMTGRRHLLPLPVLLLAGLLLIDAVPMAVDSPVGAPAVDLDAGTLLVADRGVSDPTFARTVVLLCIYHAEQGAVGVILNRPTALPVPQVLPDLDVPAGPASQVFFGGPVEPRGVRALVGASGGPGGMLHVLPDVGLLGTGPLAQAAARGLSTDRLRIYAGTTEWSPGQLEGEVRRGDWHVLDGSAEAVFDDEPVTLWQRQIQLTELVAA